MSTVKLFQSIDFKNHPYPIISVINNYNRIASGNLNERHSLLCDVYETFLKYIAIVVLAETSKTSDVYRACFPKGLDFLKHPSLGHWLSVIRDFSKQSIELDDQELWLYKIKKWYNEGNISDDIHNCYQALPEISFPKGNSTAAGICESLVTYRNKIWKGHGASALTEDALKARIPALEALLFQLLKSATFLSNMNLFWVKESVVVDKNKQSARGTLLSGVEQKHCEYVYSSFDPQEIYLAYSSSTESTLTQEPLALSPMVEWVKGEGDHYKFYFFNDAKRTKLEYLCYSDGSFYHHREIKSKLADLFGVQLDKSSENYEHILHNYTDEQRKEKSDEIYHLGQEKYESGNFESALVDFEDALEWFRSAEVIIASCQALIALNEDPDYIRSNLEGAFELEPHNDSAARLLRQINNSRASGADPGSTSKINLKEGHFTYFDLLIPARFRDYSIIFWLMSAFAYFSLTTATLAFLDKENLSTNVSVNILYMVQVIVAILLIYSARSRYLTSYFPLLGQLDNMRQDRFNNWFMLNYGKIFGNFKISPLKNAVSAEEEGNEEGDVKHWNVSLDTKKDKFALVLSIAFISIFTLGAIPTQNLTDYLLPVLLIRLFNSCVLWIVMALLLRYVIFSTLFIKEYSKLQLNPVVSAAGNNGFGSLSKICTYNIIGLTFIWIINWSWNVIVINDPLYTDFWGLSLAFAIAIFWIVFVPRFILDALKLSKSNAIATYQSHVKHAFKKFIKDPEELTIERLNWLKENEHSVLNISTRVFSLWQWTVYAVCILIVILITVLYVIYRLDPETVTRVIQQGKILTDSG